MKGQYGGAPWLCSHLLTIGHLTVWLAMANKTASALLVADLAIMHSSIHSNQEIRTECSRRQT